MSKFRNLPVIICSMSRWDGDLSSAAFSLAKELAKNNQVFYLDYPFTWKDFIKDRKSPAVQSRSEALLKSANIYQKVPGLPENFTAVTPGLMIPFLTIPRGKVFNAVLRRNNRKFFKTIEQICADHDIEEYILFNSFSPYYGFEVASKHRPRLFVYQSRDNIRAIPGLEKHGAQYERIAAGNADVVMATSSQLQKILASETGREVHLLPNAAETKLFRQVLTEDFEVPPELKDNDKPVVAYLGHIGLRLDFALLEKCIKAHPDKLFLMLGPGDYEPYSDVDFKAFPNVIFCGAKPLEQLPRYLKYTDCSVIPFLKNELTASIYPLKLNEHLAAGKAVVCTDFSEDVKAFSEVAFVAANHDQFVEAIDKAVAANSPQEQLKRSKRTARNSWSDRVELFWEILEKEVETPVKSVKS